MKKLDNKKPLEIRDKARELAKLIFLKSKDIDQIQITVTRTKKPRYYKWDGFKIEGICYKRKDLIKDIIKKKRVRQIGEELHLCIINQSDSYDSGFELLGDLDQYCKLNSEILDSFR